MNDVRPRAPLPRALGTFKQTRAQATGADLSHMEWLRQVRVHDAVAVYFGESFMGNEAVTSAPRSFITIGKHSHRISFNRSTGRMTGSKPMGRWFRIERP